MSRPDAPLKLAEILLEGLLIAKSLLSVDDYRSPDDQLSGIELSE